MYCKNKDLEKIGKHVYQCKICGTKHKVLEDEDGKAVGVKILKNETGS
jgi:ribosomal protein L37AE/L43A